MFNFNTKSTTDENSKTQDTFDWIFQALLQSPFSILILILELIYLVLVVFWNTIYPAFLAAIIGAILVKHIGARILLRQFRPNSYPEYFDYRNKKVWIKPGDHIYVHGRNRLLRKLYYHHGIYLGFGLVVHFGAENKTHPVISNLDTFIGSRVNIYKRDYGDNEIPVPLTVAIAWALCVEEKWTAYKLFWNNCEHFCSILKMGRQFSDQTNFNIVRKLKLLKEFFYKRSQKYFQKNLAVMPMPTPVGFW